MNDETTAVERLRALVDNAHGVWAPEGMREDVRDVLDELDDMRAERDALEAELPPRCTSCGERYRDGCHSEWDNSWMCSRCYVDAASARLRAPEPVGDLPPVDGGEPPP